MKAIISKILIFTDTGDKREVELNPGLNIITGDSKTGKSALLEIVDYCLFSSRSTIPKGVVENFASLYALVLKVSEKYLIIARPSSSTGNSSKCYLKVETEISSIESLTIETLLEEELRPLKEIQFEVERHLGISVLDTRLDGDASKQSGSGKASLRSSVPLLFQHQNLIANKHSIFYRFDDFFKRKKTLEDFPMLIGWADSEYFLLYRELEKKKKELAAENKLLKRLKLNNEQLASRLRIEIGNYYTLVGREIDEATALPDLKRLAKRLPDVDAVSYADTNLRLAIEEKTKQRESAKVEVEEKERLLLALESNSKLSYDSISKLGFLKASGSEVLASDAVICPVCHQHHSELNEEMEIIADSRDQLLSEVAKIHTYSEDNSGQIEDVRNVRNRLKRKVSRLSGEISALESKDKELQKSKPLRDIALRAKGATEERISSLLSMNSENGASVDIEDLKKEIGELKSKVEGFDLGAIVSDAESFLSEHMTRICNQLDFEKELKPGTLRFDLTTFSFHYHFEDKEKILLSEMGSGANWLACHLSLFLALLRLNCKSRKSSIPAFLFIDQPSQVYFPTKYGIAEEGESKEENILQVGNIFKVITAELESIRDEYDFYPQIVVMEHADEPEFEAHIRKRWKKNGDKLI
jgi:hypothetical protein